MTPTWVVSRAVLSAACGVLGAAPPASAHGPLHEQIAALTLRIRQQPRDASLYSRRGELFAQDGNTDAALSDYDRAAEIDPDQVKVDLARGRALFAAGRFSEAKAALDRYVDRRPGDAEARIARARTLSKLGRPESAVEDYTRAIREREELGRVAADEYLERAQAQVVRGGQRSEALRGLDEGIARLGPLASLELYALELELASGRYDEALARLQAVAAPSSRQEPWLVRRAEILEQAGRSDEARLAYAQARTILDALPPRQRQTRATLELAKRANDGLARLQEAGYKEASP